MSRTVPEWIGKSDDAMPSIHVRLRIYAKQNGICACGCGRVMNLNRDKVDCDHILALRDGGLNVESNLQLLLAEHHKEKTRAENIARGEERRHKAKAFTRQPSRLKGRQFEKSPGQHNATRQTRKWAAWNQGVADD